MLARKQTRSNMAQGKARKLTSMMLGLLPLLALPSMATGQNITVTSPLNNQTVTSPVAVTAHSAGCNGFQPISFGYSIDNRSSLALGTTASDINVVDTSISSGTHKFHFKSWTSQGICPVVDVTVTVGGSTGPTHGVPSNAISSGILDGSNGWKWNHDAGTPGSSVGSSKYPVSSPSLDGLARQYSVSYSQHGGEIYHVSFGRDAAATHFVYDAYVYFTDPSQVANLEMDMNQVVPDGKTMILGTQCSGYSRSWEYVLVTGNKPHWHPSNIPCNPKTWAANTWHHIQIASHRDNKDNVTYDWVNVDETYSDFKNAAGFDALSLGWASGDLLINMQFDGASSGSGSITAYTDKLKVWRW